MKLHQLLIFLFFILSCSVSSFGQKQLDHTKRIYTSPEGKIYIQKSLPVYLRIATSPDADAKSYLLKSKETSKYSNPMYFDTEGWNTVRSPSAVDTNTREPVYPQRDIIFEVYADSKPPASRVDFSREKKYADGDVLYFGGDVKLHFSGEDATSGLEQIFCSVDGQSYQPYGDSLRLEQEGRHRVKYYAIDHVRNVEQPEAVEMVIDKTPPQTSYSIEGENTRNILGQEASIRLSSSDSLSGVDHIRYSVNNGPEKIYSGPIPVRNFQEASNKLVFYGVDQVGNQEAKESLTSSVQKEQGGDNGDGSFSYYIDREAPEVKLHPEGGHYEGEHLYINGRTKIKLVATDQKSGVKKITYSINNSTLSQVYDQPFLLEGQGMHYVNFAAEDQVSNVSARKNRPVYRDTGKPSSDLRFEGAHYRNRDTVFVKSSTAIHLSAEDDHSGVGKILYAIDGQKPDVYEQPVHPNNDGLHIFTYQAVDRVNNRQEERKVKMFLDSKAPEIYHHFSVKSIGTKTVRDDQYTIYPSNSQLYIASTDMACGTEQLKYRINDGQWKSQIPIPGFDPGNYTVEIKAVDYLGNESTSTVQFAIEH